MSSERLARLTLSLVAEPGDVRLTRLVGQYGAELVLERLRDPARRADLGADLHDRLLRACPDDELSRAESLGIRFVAPGDDEWPRGLDRLASAPELHDRGGVPIGLWVRGPMNLARTVERAVAIVGSRSASTYGGDAASTIAAGVAEQGWSVVSGAALGIDFAAHRGALAVRGPTVAVLACGADRVYPSAHRRLLEYLAETGLIVSETPPGGAPTKIRFLGRNRLIAALSSGTVVVEAALRSGALNTANWASGCGRVLMAVPGNVNSATSSGSHLLIRERGALLVTSAEEVVEALSPVGTAVSERPSAPVRPQDRLTTVQLQVLDAVPRAEHATLDAVALAAGVAPTRVRGILVRLEGLGLVRRGAVGWRLTEVSDGDPGEHAGGHERPDEHAGEVGPAAAAEVQQPAVGPGARGEEPGGARAGPAR